MKSKFKLSVLIITFIIFLSACGNESQSSHTDYENEMPEYEDGKEVLKFYRNVAGHLEDAAENEDETQTRQSYNLARDFYEEYIYGNETIYERIDYDALEDVNRYLTEPYETDESYDDIYQNAKTSRDALENMVGIYDFASEQVDDSDY